MLQVSKHNITQCTGNSGRWVWWVEGGCGGGKVGKVGVVGGRWVWWEEGKCGG